MARTRTEPAHNADDKGTAPMSRGAAGDDTDPESVAIAALGWIAADPDMLDRFTGVTGIAPAAMRQAAGTPGFLAGVLDFIVAHEPTLLRFCETEGLDPAHVAQAGQVLHGPAG